MDRKYPSRGELVFEILSLWPEEYRINFKGVKNYLTQFDRELEFMRVSDQRRIFLVHLPNKKISLIYHEPPGLPGDMFKIGFLDFCAGLEKLTQFRDLLFQKSVCD